MDLYGQDMDGTNGIEMGTGRVNRNGGRLLLEGFEQGMQGTYSTSVADEIKLSELVHILQRATPQPPW